MIIGAEHNFRMTDPNPNHNLDLVAISFENEFTYILVP